MALVRVFSTGDSRQAESPNRLKSPLDEGASVHFVNTPWREAIKVLADKHGVRFIIDEAEVREWGISDEAINLVVSGPRLRSVLKLILDPLYLTIVPQGDSFLVTTQEGAMPRQRTVAYPIHDFAAQHHTVNELMHVIRNDTAPGKWKAIFPDHPSAGTVEYSKSSESLIVTQFDDVHEEIETLLRRLRRPLKPGESIDQFADTTLERRVQQALDRSTSLDFHNTPLRQAIEQISRNHRIPLVIDPVAVSWEELEPDAPLNFRIADVTLRSALGIMLRPLGLTFLVKDEVVLITSDGVASDFWVTCSYAVGDLLDESVPSASSDGWGQIPEAWSWDRQPTASEELIDLVAETPAVWGYRTEGSGGAIRYLSSLRSVVVRNTPADHRLVALLFSNLHKAIRSRRPVDAFAPIGAQAVQTNKLRETLKRHAEPDFQNTPLSDAIREISRQNNANIVLDERAFREEEVPIDQRVSGRMSGTLGSGLRALLQPNGLDYKIRDEVIQVVPQPATSTRFYPLEGIDAENGRVHFFFGTTRREVFSNLLSDRFTEMFEPDEDHQWHWFHHTTSWRFSPANVLVVCHTEAAHDEIAELLDCLREQRPRASGTNGRKVDWDVYPIPKRYRTREATDRFVETLRREVASDTWSTYGIPPIRSVNRCLVIAQTGDVHRALRDWFHRHGMP